MQFKPIAIRTADHPPMSSVHMDAIRGAAALVVLLGHTRGLFFASFTGNNQPTSSTEHILVGDGAVMIFFVLSGFLVGGGVIRTIARDTWSWQTYLIKRFTRLWIVLIPALLLGVVLDHVGLNRFPSPTAVYAGPSGQQEVHDVSQRLSPLTIAGNAAFLQTIAVDTAGTNNSLWSLANEAWYYIAFPMALLALKRNQKTAKRCAYLLATVAIAFFVGKAITLLFFIFLLGACISLLPLRLPTKLAKPLAILSIACMPILIVAVKRLQLPKYPAEAVVALAFSAALYFLLHQTEPPKGALYPTISGLFSRISYTLYLVHLPLAVFLCACINNPWRRWAITPRNLAIYFTLNACLILASCLVYLTFEANTDKARGFLLSLVSRRA